MLACAARATACSSSGNFSERWWKLYVYTIYISDFSAPSDLKWSSSFFTAKVSAVPDPRAPCPKTLASTVRIHVARCEVIWCPVEGVWRLQIREQNMEVLKGKHGSYKRPGGFIRQNIGFMENMEVSYGKYRKDHLWDISMIAGQAELATGDDGWTWRWA